MIVLDTDSLIWWVSDDEQLSDRARKAIQKEINSEDGQEFLVPMSISQPDLASAVHVSYQRVNDLVNQSRGVTPSTALRLAKYFGMSPDFCLNLQVRW